MDIERRFISKVLDEPDALKVALERRITAEYFEDDSHREVYAYLLDYWAEYGEIPTEDVIRDRFGWKPCEAPEPAIFYVDQIIEARSYSHVLSALAEAKEPMRERDVAKAMTVLSEGLMKAAIDKSEMRDFDIHSDWEAWWAGYVGRGEDLIGVPTGFPMLDYATAGWQPEQLVTLVGPPKAGKSTLALRLAKAAVDFGIRPLFVSFEMSAEEQRMRYYAMLAKIDYTKFLQRRLSKPERDRLQKVLRQYGNMPPFIISTDISKGTTVAALQAKIAMYQPLGLVIVDGVYLMDAEVQGVSEMDPRALTALTRNLKRMAQNLRLPVLITHQVLESRFSMKKGIRSADIGYSSSFAQDSDVIIGVAKDTEEAEERRLSIVLARNAAPKSTLVSWDWTTSTFEEMEDYEEMDPEDFQ